MTDHDRLVALASELFGAFGWQTAVAKKYEVHRSTVHRWRIGSIPMPPDLLPWLEQEAATKVATIRGLVAE